MMKSKDYPQRHHTPEHRRKISESQKGEKGYWYGKHPSPETLKKLSESHNGIRISEEHKKILSELKKGKTLTLEHRAKMSESHKGKKFSLEHRKKIGDAIRGEKNTRWKGGRIVYKHKRRSLLAKTNGIFAAEEWEALKKKYDYRCPVCNKQEPQIKLTVDHIIPLSKGGSNYITNIQPLCFSCNRKKTTRIFRIKPNGELRLF